MERRRHITVPSGATQLLACSRRRQETCEALTLRTCSARQGGRAQEVGRDRREGRWWRAAEHGGKWEAAVKLCS